MAIPINEDPYSNGLPSNFWNSFESLVPGPTYRPDSLEVMCTITKYTKREIQILYRSFKQGCPSGIVTLKQFQEIFAQFFPNGNPKRYAELVFKTLDEDLDLQISFEEFLVGLSVITRGTLREKFEWIFTLYDINRNGYIGQGELLIVIQSMHELVGRGSKITPINYRNLILDHALNVYNKLCQNGEKYIYRNEFVELCLKNKEICDSLQLFVTIL